MQHTMAVAVDEVDACFLVRCVLYRSACVSFEVCMCSVQFCMCLAQVCMCLVQVCMCTTDAVSACFLLRGALTRSEGMVWLSNKAPYHHHRCAVTCDIERLGSDRKAHHQVHPGKALLSQTCAHISCNVTAQVLTCTIVTWVVHAGARRGNAAAALRCMSAASQANFGPCGSHHSGRSSRHRCQHGMIPLHKLSNGILVLYRTMCVYAHFATHCGRQHPFEQTLPLQHIAWTNGLACILSFHLSTLSMMELACSSQKVNHCKQC